MKNSKLILLILCLFFMNLLYINAQQTKMQLYSISASIGQGRASANPPNLYIDIRDPSFNNFWSFAPGVYIKALNFNTDLAFKYKRFLLAFMLNYGNNSIDRERNTKENYIGGCFNLGWLFHFGKNVDFEPYLGISLYNYKGKYYDQSINNTSFGGNLRLKLLYKISPRFSLGIDTNLTSVKYSDYSNINLNFQYRFH